METVTNQPSNRNSINYRDQLKKDSLERRRNIVHLIIKYLEEHNYKNTVECLLDECQVEWQYQVCENVDLEIVLQEYQSYYHTKFQKYPKILRKVEEGARPQRLVRKRSNEKARIDVTQSDKKDEPFHIDISPLTKLPQVQIDNHHDDFACDYPVEMKEMADVMRQQILPKTNSCTFANCLALESTVETIKEAIVYPFQHRNLFENVLGWRGVLLYGPPGTGKTLLARAVANEAPVTFVNVTSSVFTSKWRGDSEKMIKVLFDMSRHMAPTTIFMDEIDSLVSSSGGEQHEASRRFRSELLTQIDGVTDAYDSGDRVFVLATTNAPWAIDDALLRRFEKRILVPMPDREARADMIRHFMGQNKLPTKDFERIVQATDNFTGSDLKSVRKEIDMALLRERLSQIKEQGRTGPMRKITTQDFFNALDKIKPSVKADSYKKYLEWADKYGAV